MSDHWNSLADLLGTPSINPPPKKATPTKKTEREIARTSSEHDSPAPSADSGSEGSGSSAIEKPFQPPAPPPVKAEQPSRLRSSWDTVARLFGVTSSSELPPAASEPPKASPIASKEIASDPEDDLFAGFGRKKERPRDEQPSRTPPAPAISEREPVRPKKKPTSFWDSPVSENDEKDLAPPTSTRSFEQPEPASRFASNDDNDESGIVPERRGRTRNVRRGRGSESREESPREVSSEAESGRERTRNEPEARRSERPERSERTERTERTSEGNRSGRGDRPERSPSRSSQDRPPAAERASGNQRVPSAERTSTGDRPPRDGERRPRDDGRVARTNDRSGRGEKRSVESDEKQSARTSDRAPRSERPVRDNDTQDRPSRGRNPRRESFSAEDEGDWDSREVGFDDSEPIETDQVASEPRSEGEESADAPTRSRRRRRRGGRRTSADAKDRSVSDEAPGRQAYGRSSANEDLEDDHEEVESLRLHKVTSWLDAISPMIDANMENHKRNPGGDRHRGGGGGGSRRRNNNSGNSNR